MTPTEHLARLEAAVVLARKALEGALQAGAEGLFWVGDPRHMAVREAISVLAPLLPKKEEEA